MAGKTFTPIEGDLGKLLYKVYDNVVRTGFVRVNGVIMPENYRKFADVIENFEVRDDDLWVCSFPKTGTTWVQEMSWLIANDIDLEGAKQPLGVRCPFFDLSCLYNYEEIERRHPHIKFWEHEKDSVGQVAKRPSPRFIKSHLPFQLLPRQLREGKIGAKIIYVVRNPKDTCISYYHYTKLYETLKGTFEDWCNLFVGDTIMYGPFHDHVLGYWKQKSDDLLFLKYEDMKRDLPSILNETAKFMGKSLATDDLSILTDLLSFEKMKVNPAVNWQDVIKRVRLRTNNYETGEFMRCGQMGQWKTEMNPEMIKRFDDWSAHSLKDSGLFF